MYTLTLPFSWAERRPVLLDRFFYIPPVYHRHAEWDRIPWSHPDLFGNERPVFVEYCSGNGQWIAEQAIRHPEVNWVAVEKKIDRAAKAWSLLKREAISNLYVVYSEGEIFTRYYVPRKSLAGIYVNFPDPWSKRYQQKNRILRVPFLEAVEEALAPGGEAICVTDDLPYCEAIRDLFQGRPRWKSFFEELGFVTDWPDFGDSFFKLMWQRAGRQIYYQRYIYGH